MVVPDLARLSSTRRTIPSVPNSSRTPLPAVAITRSTTNRTVTATRTRTRTATRTATRTRTGTRTRTATATARTQTRHDDAFVVAIIDNTVRDVGFCAYNLHGFDVQMRQFPDSNSYTTLITVLCVFAPVEILLSLSSAGGLLDHALQACPHLANVKRTFIGRTYFNETYGALVAENLSNQPCPTLARLGESSCYLALACCGALIRYIEHVEDLAFAPSSLRIRFQPNQSTVFLDMSTLEGLEVVSNARLVNGLHGPSRPASLLTVLDNTKTRAGKRFLRRSLLEPCADITTITMRQDTVEELGNSEETYFALVSVLSKFPDLERAMAALMSREHLRLRTAAIKNVADDDTQVRPASDDSSDDDMPAPAPPSRLGAPLVDTAPPSVSLIQNVLTVKLALQAIESMLDAIQDSQSPLLRAIAESMRSANLLTLRNEIAEVIDADAVPAKDVERMRMSGAFAVKAGRNGRLDTARKILSENIEDMQALTDELRNKYGLYKMELRLHAKRGYHLSIPARLLDFNDFPEEFIQIDEGKKIHRFSTEELAQLNLRYQDSLQQVWRFTEVELGGLLKDIFQPTMLRGIHRLCDSTAILDCIASFVTYTSLSQIHTTRPKMTESGPVAFQQAYHPVLYDCRPQTTVPNDVFLDEASALHIMSGRNQAGKSTYLRKVGLLCIMAHTGCNVPAKYASVRVLRRIVTIFSLGDEVSQSQSHFSKEMNDVTTVFDSIYENDEGRKRCKKYQDVERTEADWDKVPNILVLIDELGRSTSTLDGFAIAYAVAEKLAACRRVLTLFATHFLGLAAMSTVNPVVKSFHIGTKNSEATRSDQPRNPNEEPGKRPDYKVKEGVLAVSNYGIETARLAGFPSDVVDDAMDVRSSIPVRRIALPTEFADVHFKLTDPEKLQIRKTSSAVSIAQRLRLINVSTSDPEERERLCGKLRKRMKQSHPRETKEQA